MSKQRPKPSRSRHNYHDADILSLEWTKPNELAVALALDSPGPSPCKLYFLNVKNRDEIDAKFAESESQRPTPLRLIEGLFILARGEYKLGPLTIRCDAIFEP